VWLCFQLVSPRQLFPREVGAFRETRNAWCLSWNATATPVLGVASRANKHLHSALGSVRACAYDTDCQMGTMANMCAPPRCSVAASPLHLLVAHRSSINSSAVYQREDLLNASRHVTSRHVTSRHVATDDGRTAANANDDDANDDDNNSIHTSTPNLLTRRQRDE